MHIMKFASDGTVLQRFPSSATSEKFDDAVKKAVEK